MYASGWITGPYSVVVNATKWFSNMTGSLYKIFNCTYQFHAFNNIITLNFRFWKNLTNILTLKFIFYVYYILSYILFAGKNGTELVGRYHTRGWSQQEANQTMVHKGTVEISRVSESQHTAALGLITTALYKVRVGFSRYETSASLKPWSQTINGSVKHGSGFEKVHCFSSIRQGLGESFEVAPSQQKRFIRYQEK